MSTVPQRSNASHPRERLGAAAIWSGVLGVAVFVAVAIARRGAWWPDASGPVVIAGGSMANTLRGAHYSLTCTDCGFPFECGAEYIPADAWLACPNCGHGEPRVFDRPPVGGDRVRIERWTSESATPARGDVVALKQPDASGEWAVKRVVGLPGERIAIRHGDLYADGRVLRATLEQFRQRAVLVHDDRYRPRSDTGPLRRWEVDTPSTESARHGTWSDTATGHRYIPSTEDLATPTPPDATSWLRYRHLCTYTQTARRAVEVPVRDFLAYDASSSRSLQVVTDLAVSGRVAWEAGACVSVAIDNGRERCVVSGLGRGCELRVDWDGARATSDTRRSADETSDDMWPVPGAWSELLVALFDQQLVVAVGGRTLGTWAYQPGDQLPTAITRPIAIGAAGGGVHVAELKVWRDIHYLPPDLSDQDWTMPGVLALDEYFVVGDHPFLSVDSRHWPPRSVSRTVLRGKVVPLERHAR